VTTDTRDALLNAARRIDERCAKDGEGPIRRFERLAEMFRRETGFMAPGKDAPAAGYAGEGHERQRQAAWEAWSKAPFDELRAALRTPRPESDARDAARYRWLRQYLLQVNAHGMWMAGVVLDRYCDAALTQPEATR